jgi:hypothetical protein
MSGWASKRMTLDPGRAAIALYALAHPEAHIPFLLAEQQRRARVARRRAWWRAVGRRWGAR